MHHSRRIVPRLAFVAVLAVAAGAEAGWVLNGTAINTYASSLPEIVGDGAGGAIVVWPDGHSGLYADLYAQRLDSYGEPLWNAGGVPVCTAAGNQMSVKLAADGAGGAFVIWEDFRAGPSNGDIYAQRLAADGNLLWGEDLAIATGTDTQFSPDIVADGAGGAYVCYHRVSPQYDVYAARISAAGQLVGPLSLGVAGSYERYPRIAPDGVGGAVVVWRDTRNGHADIYGQRVDAWMTPLWTPGGMAICGQAGEQESPRVMFDGGACTIVVWNDLRDGNYDVYAQKLNSVGTSLWMFSGLPVCTATENQYAVVSCSDGAEGAIVTWQDSRAGVYAQRIGATGTLLWGATGALLSTYFGNYPTIVADGAGGAVVAWSTDYQGTSDLNIYAQRVSGAGVIYGPAAGVALCTVIGQQSSPVLTPDGAGGALLAWVDFRNQMLGGTFPLIHAQRIERNGFWGYPAPEIAAVRDVPGDQGGFLYVDWDASRLDPWPEERIDSYSLWKAVDAAVAAGKPAAPTIRIEQDGDKVHYWELVAEMAANGYEHYSKRVATDFDSTGTHFAHLHFQVCAHAGSPAATWTSRPDSGYSVDNLAPAAPLALAGEQGYAPPGLTLSWRANREADLDSYRVYRGASEDFVPAAGNLVAATADTTCFDAGSDGSVGWWYKVAAVDIHGNQSPFAVLGPDGLTGAGGGVPGAVFLAQNRPNPFNPRTVIGFDLPRDGGARLEVFGADGRLVRVLASGTLLRGRHEAVWDGCDQHGRAAASGVYFCRLAAGDAQLMRKLVLLR
jgi:hypothetical protein